MWTCYEVNFLTYPETIVLLVQHKSLFGGKYIHPLLLSLLALDLVSRDTQSEKKMKSIWKSVALEGILLVLLVFDSAVESVVTTEWSITEEYTMAWLNVTYINPTNNKLHSENLEVSLRVIYYIQSFRERFWLV